MRQIATVLFTFGIIGLFVLARDRKVQTSKALWLPVVWLFISGSRNVADWLQMSAPSTDADRYLEGNPVDRNALTGLLVLGLMVLIARRRQVMAVIRTNPAIVVYFVYCGVSVLWSDFPDVAFKRWIRASGDLVMVFVVLTDLSRLDALKRVLVRVGFLLLPISILFIRYYPELGRVYSRWTGRMFWTGVTTEKNTLGVICMIFGLVSVWHLLEAWRNPLEARKAGPLVAHSTVVAMAVWLLFQVDSATAFACFFLAGGVMTLATWPAFAKKTWLVHVLVVSVLSVAAAALFVSGTDLVEYVGRDSTLTGRTEIWRIVIQLTPNRWVGTGFESFWLGDRLKTMWALYYNQPNQAHNGYIEIFLNLGWLGVFLLAISMLTGYGRIVAAVRRQADLGSLRLAFFIAAAIYNCTEGGFKMMHPAWMTLLFAITAMPPLPVAEVDRRLIEGPISRVLAYRLPASHGARRAS